MYKLGAIKNPKDLRDIHIAKVQAPVAVPYEYSTDISFIPVLNQKNNGSCVGHAHAIIHIYNEYKENKKIPKLSPRYLYALSKKIDGYTGEGTFPRVTASIQFNKGCATENTVINNNDLPHSEYINIVENDTINKDAIPYKIKGYVTINNDPNLLKQAILTNGLIATSISVGNYISPIKKGSLGYHRVVVYGWVGDRFLFRNSWGSEWGNNGNGYFDFADQALMDNMAFVDLPNEVLEEAKNKYKYFTEREVKGLKPELVRLLDKMRGECGFPFVINSGFRTPEQNKKLSKSVDDSAHLTGEAVDLRVRNSQERYKLFKSAILNNVSRIGVGDTFIHLDISTKLPQNVIWKY